MSPTSGSAPHHLMSTNSQTFPRRITSPSPATSSFSAVTLRSVIHVGLRVAGEADVIAAFPFADVASDVGLRVQAAAGVLAAVMISLALAAALPTSRVRDEMAGQLARRELLFSGVVLAHVTVYLETTGP